jgi:hypothetical protein
MVTQIRTIFYLGIICLYLGSCSRLEESEKEKIRRRNCTTELIYRTSNEKIYPLNTPIHTPRSSYLWEAEGNLPKITKEFFRCKGSPLNPPISLADLPTPILDCEGGSHHGLPIFQGKESVYPILIELLNFIQKKTGRRVIITCGHRCPTHNIYADSLKENLVSKHQIGAEVDFYVQGMEDRPQEIIGLLMQYYQETPTFSHDKEYLEFKRYDKPDARVKIQPWMNKEIYIKLYLQDEGRDRDNRHPYPYVSIQVRYDRMKKEKVLYDWAKATKGYSRSS